MALKNFGSVDLCDDCVMAVEYGNAPTEYQTITDNLGVAVAFFDSPEDEDGHFSHMGCEGCLARGCHVYNGYVLTEDDF
jgi:hypothetical protein